MNIALIFAGGTGQRMNTRARPKQFLELHGKPIILYTLEHFEKHPEINAIVVVCLAEWIDDLWTLVARYGLTKIKLITPGGDTGHTSVYNGLAAMSGEYSPDDIVLIHDGVRPLINEATISDNIATARTCGNAITAEPAIESVVKSSNGKTIDSVPPLKDMYTAKAPQTFRYGEVLALYRQAARDRRLSIDTAHLCSMYGIKMHLVKSPPNNIKITAPHDYFIFRALYEAHENQQILGI